MESIINLIIFISREREAIGLLWRYLVTLPYLTMYSGAFVYFTASIND